MIYSRNITPEDKKELETFYKREYPQWKSIHKYLEKTIFSLSFPQIEDSLIICDDKEIIGVNLCISTKVMIENAEHNIIWSFDTLVLPEYRSTDAGTFIAEFWFKRKDIFGAGLSEISEKMCKVMKSKFIAYATAYLKLNLTSKYLINLLRPIYSLDSLNQKEFPASIKVKNLLFERLHTPEDFVSQPSGYWNSDIIEFKRDRDFIAWRFFQPGTEYILYQNKEENLYFAVRITEWHNVPLLYLVDYRFELSNTNRFNDIINAAYFLVKRLNCAGLYIRCSLESLKNICKKKHFIKKGQGAQIVTRFKPAVRKDYPVFFTAADSDMDFK